MTSPAFRRPLLVMALLLALLKSLEFAIDSTPVFCSDSGAFVINALRLDFLPERSYVYGFLIRAFALPWRSLPAIVVLQVAMGGVSAWLLGFTLLRYFKVRPWIAILASLAFAIDPAQVMDEHMVMTETASLLAMAVFLLIACSYLDSPHLWRLVCLACAGAVLVSLRIVYLPPVLAVAAILPLAAHRSRPRALALALAVSCGATFLFQSGYRHLTGWLAGREPAYHYKTGFFLVSAVAPLVDPADANDPRVRRAISEQNHSEFPLGDVDSRPRQLWSPEGFIVRLKAVFGGDTRQANQAADRLARAAILRRPAGFLKLGLLDYRNYWKQVRYVRFILPWEIGTGEGSTLLPSDSEVIRRAFGVDVSANRFVETRSRRYYLWGSRWIIFLLLAPFLSAAALWVRPPMLPVILLFAWNWLLLVSTCLGAVDPVYRYLHPYSFTGLAAAAFLAEKLLLDHDRSPRVYSAKNEAHRDSSGLLR